MQFAWLFTFLSTAAAPLVKKVLVALGFGMVSYVGINSVVSQAKNYLMSNMAGIPADIAQLMGLFKFDVAINITIAAVTTRMMLAGVNKLAGSKTGIGSVGNGS